MAIIRRVVCIRNVWRLDNALNYINILQPVYVFLYGYTYYNAVFRILIESQGT